jgi:hypothetical protein
MSPKKLARFDKVCRVNRFRCAGRMTRVAVGSTLCPFTERSRVQRTFLANPL